MSAAQEPAANKPVTPKTLDAVLAEMRAGGVAEAFRQKIIETLDEAIVECMQADDAPEDRETAKQGLLTLLAQEALRCLPEETRVLAYRSQFCVFCGGTDAGRCTCMKEE